eukprot:2307059-Pleurochrysis_carterae.AAC.1
MRHIPILGPVKVAAKVKDDVSAAARQQLPHRATYDDEAVVLAQGLPELDNEGGGNDEHAAVLLRNVQILVPVIRPRLLEVVEGTKELHVTSKHSVPCTQGH